MLATPLESTSGASWALVDHVHATTVEGDMVLLDVSTDAYHCLPAGALDIQIGEDRATLRISSAELASEMHSAGIIRPLSGGPATSRRRTAQAPTASLLKRSYPPPTWMDAPQVGAAVLDVALAYRARSLSQIVNRRVALRAHRAAATLEQTLDRFHRWIPYAPVSGKCLLRAFMLRRILHEHGHPHDWVFGVTLWPFKAHCWLQAEGLVLDDTCENVAAYRPIMVV